MATHILEFESTITGVRKHRYWSSKAPCLLIGEEDQAKAALKAAREVNGNVRVLSKQRQPVHATRDTRGDGTTHSDSAGPSTDSAQNWHSGYVQFWHVVHVRPVWDGGGQCDIDNLRTLCTPCHQAITAQQPAKHAKAWRISKAASAGNITAFFKNA